MSIVDLGGQTVAGWEFGANLPGKMRSHKLDIAGARAIQ